MNTLNPRLVSGLTNSINGTVSIRLHWYGRSNPVILGFSTLALTLFLALTWGSPAQAGGFNVDSLVTFTPLPSTYRTVTNAGCPAGFAGKFTFTAQLTNKPDSPAMPGLDVFVQTLTNGNVLLDPQTNAVLGGVGAVMEIPRVGQYADGLLSANEAVDVPFVVCLKTRQSFQFFVDVFGIVTKLVSINRGGTDSGHGGFWNEDHPAERTTASISADGRFVAFSTDENDLVANDNNGTLGTDVFVRDLQTGMTTLVSVNQAGTDSGNGGSGGPVLGADGRFVAFTSGATDLVATDTNGTADVFVRDLQTGTTTLVSVNRAGTDSGNSGSSGPVISADGRFVAFTSDATDLVATDTNGALDVFVRDLQTGTTTLVSVNRAGSDSGSNMFGGDSSSSGPAISPDGRFVAFTSGATDLVATDTNGTSDVFVRDLQTGTTTLVSVNRAGTDSGNRGSGSPVLSADGRFVAFTSVATDLVATNTNGRGDVFVRDLQTGTTSLVSINRFGTGSSNEFGNGSSPVISADGRFVAFESRATDLVATDTNGFSDVFVRDLQTGITTLVSVNLTGTGSGGEGPVISPDGRFVAFVSGAADLVTTVKNNGIRDVFVRDLQTGTTTLVTVNREGTNSGKPAPFGGGLGSSGVVLSADGRFVAFISDESDLVETDTNGTNPRTNPYDVFVRPIQQ